MEGVFTITVINYLVVTLFYDLVRSFSNLLYSISVVLSSLATLFDCFRHRDKSDYRYTVNLKETGPNRKIWLPLNSLFL